jgi:hypothetical protein
MTTSYVEQNLNDPLRALGHAEAAEQLLHDVHGRTNEGPAFGAVKADAAVAHALLALVFQAGAQAGER